MKVSGNDPFDLSSYQEVKDRAENLSWVLGHPTPALTMPCDKTLASRLGLTLLGSG